MQLYTLPELPYAFGSLEPYIDALTMEIHHDRHHAAYIENLNKALDKHPELYNIPLPELLADLSKVPADIRTAVRNNGGGTLNHTEFWKWMTPHGDGAPKGKSGQHLMQQWQSFKAFQDEFNAAAKTRFGSGWAWLCLNKHGNLEITSTANQDSPLSEGLQPILGLDVWEHAYYLKYMNRRPDYINAWWHVVNWEYVEELYEKGYTVLSNKKENAMVKKGDTFHIGQICPESGVYRLVKSEGRSEDQKEIPLTKGEKFPPCRNCTGEVLWEFVRKA